LPAPTLLVLDDFHVITNAEVMTALTDLVSQRSNVHLVLLTRIDPPMPMHRLRLAGVLAEVSASDLAFDGVAVRRLAAGAESLELSDSTLSEVLARTEGWPAGVRLATMFLARGDSDPSQEGFGGTDRSVAEYLVSEVLQRNTSDVRDFLLRTSVVEVISGPSRTRSSRAERARPAEALVEANQFITSVNPERTVFRYHPMLRDLLLHTLQHDDPVGFARRTERPRRGTSLTDTRCVRSVMRLLQRTGTLPRRRSSRHHRRS
jgi:LuxR family maltose regulon positive regulatory protein